MQILINILIAFYAISTNDYFEKYFTLKLPCEKLVYNRAKWHKMQESLLSFQICKYSPILISICFQNHYP